MASKTELEKENEDLKAQIIKMQKSQKLQGQILETYLKTNTRQRSEEVQKLEETNVRFSQGENVYTAEINQTGHLVIQCTNTLLFIAPISNNAIAFISKQ